MKFRIAGKKKKEVYAAAFIILIGNFLGAGMIITQAGRSSVEYLERNEYGEGDYEENLKVRTQGKQQEIQIQVKEKQYQDGEIKTYMEEAKEKLEGWLEIQMNEEGILNHNLEFPQQLEENPAVLSWSTDHPELLSWDGTLGERIPQEGAYVNLACTILLGEAEQLWKKKVRIEPPEYTSAQELQMEIQRQAESISDSYSEKLYLPQTIQGEKVQYEEEENIGILLCAGSVILGIGMLPLSKEKEKQKQEKRQREMQMDYPEIVEKLALFLRAGFSIRKSMEKLAEGYVRNREKYHMGERAAYEELLKTCKEMEGGVYEADAYERLGKRCGLSQYKILSVLLVQNLRKGNQSILELLEREAASAGEERKRNARVKGEEASTKLLLPMVLQLIVVLIILMVPAFLSFV